jgi:DNA-directed RNA polymerase subunit RPC12/RpoP
MLITGIKSRPTYDELRPLPRARRHIIAAQGTGGEAVTRLLGSMSNPGRNVELLYSSESFSGNDLSARLKDLDCLSAEFFPTNAGLVQRLSVLLASAEIGTALYLAGSETFIGRAMQVSSEHDLRSDQVLREHCGTLARRVICMHCGAYNEDIAQRVFRCNSCREHLVVRDHYSRHWAAFMGVKADAETPGIIPPNEDLDT